MKSAAGTYMEDAWIPFAFAGINLVASIILARVMGVAGVYTAEAIADATAATLCTVIFAFLFTRILKKCEGKGDTAAE